MVFEAPWPPQLHWCILRIHWLCRWVHFHKDQFTQAILPIHGGHPLGVVSNKISIVIIFGHKHCILREKFNIFISPSLWTIYFEIMSVFWSKKIIFYGDAQTFSFLCIFIFYVFWCSKVSSYYITLQKKSRQV